MRFGLDGDFAGIGELDGIADEINQHLGQAPAIAWPGGSSPAISTLNASFLSAKHWDGEICSGTSKFGEHRGNVLLRQELGTVYG